MKALVAAMLLLATAAISAGVDREIATSAALTRTTFLSSEEAQAAITVFNGTNAQIALDLGEIKYFVYSGGQSNSTRYCLRDCWRGLLRIEPGARKTVHVTLPSCEVLSDPCTEDVSMEYPIRIGNESDVRVVRFPRYRFIPDPNAVYRNVTDGRPVFVAQGFANTTVTPSTIIVGVTAAPSASFSATPTPPPIFGDVAKVLAGAGVAVSKTEYETDNPRWYHPLLGRSSGEMRLPRYSEKPNAWRALFTVKNGGQQLAAINEALQRVRERFGAQVSTINEGVPFSVSDDVNPGVWKAAEDDAQPQAEHLAELTRSGDIGVTNTERATSSVSFENEPEMQYDPLAEIVFPSLSSLRPLKLNLRVQMTYIGARTPSLQIAPAVAAQAKRAFRSVWAVPTLALAAETAADRQQLYIIGGASGRASLQAGLAPYAVALLNAREQTQNLAKLLGVRAGQEALFAAYSRPSSQDQAVGVATTFTGDYTQGSKRIEPVRGMRIFQLRDTNARINVPIQLPHPETTLTETNSVDVPLTSNFLRFEMEVNTIGGPVNLAAGVAATLRRMPGVVDAAATTYGGADVRFEVLVRNSSRSLLPRLAGVVQTAYAAFQPSASFDLRAFVPDCSAIEQQLLRIGLRKNWISAEKDAKTARVRIRRFLLATVAPTDEGLACPPLARDPGSLSYDTIDGIPSALQAQSLAVSSMMVFRTAPLDQR